MQELSETCAKKVNKLPSFTKYISTFFVVLIKETLNGKVNDRKIQQSNFFDSNLIDYYGSDGSFQQQVEA